MTALLLGILGVPDKTIVDDFVLLSALCGNDFMPHLPSLDIGEGALDIILATYREQLPKWGGYLQEGGLINFDRLEKLLSVLGDGWAYQVTYMAINGLCGGSIVSVQTGQCVDVWDCGTADGTLVDLYACHVGTPACGDPARSTNQVFSPPPLAPAPPGRRQASAARRSLQPMNSNDWWKRDALALPDCTSGGRALASSW